MPNPAISLIIPVYNVEDYLEKALLSVQNQTFRDFEAIIVDDGSTDKSLEIIKKFCEKNSNFIFLTQKNKGPAAARNYGISVCKGDYIAFMDSDDYIEPEFLEMLYKTAIENDADITCCNFNLYYPEKDIKVYMPFTSMPGVYSKTKALRKLILDLGTHYFVWNKLSKRKLFFENNLKFDDMYFEDIATSPKLFYYADKIVLIGKALYNYTSRRTSILHSMDVVKMNDFIKSLGVIRNFLENEQAYDDYKTHLWLYAQRVKFLSYYHVLMLHTKAMNFNGFLENIGSVTKSIDYFMDEKFKPVPGTSVLDLIATIKKPGKIIKVAKKPKKQKPRVKK